MQTTWTFFPTAHQGVLAVMSAAGYATGMILAGSLLLAGGIASAVVTGLEVGLFSSNVSDSPTGVAFMTINGVIAAAGLALIVIGVLPHARVVNPYLTLSTPQVVRSALVLFSF